MRGRARAACAALSSVEEGNRLQPGFPAWLEELQEEAGHRETRRFVQREAPCSSRKYVQREAQLPPGGADGALLTGWGRKVDEGVTCVSARERWCA